LFDELLADEPIGPVAFSLLTGSADNPVASGALGLVFAVASAAIFDGIGARWLRHAQPASSERKTRRVALLGHDRPCRSLAERLGEIAGDLRIVGVFVLAESMTADSAANGSTGVVDAVVALARDDAIDEVVIAAHSLDDPFLVPAIEQLSAYSVDIALSPGALGPAVADLTRAAGAPLPLLPLVRRPICGWGARAKRALDIVVSALAMLLLLPAFAVIAVAIKLDSPGPVLYKQRRGGLNQKPFLVWKFRTMRCRSDEGAVFRQASRGDMRITRVGRLLRQLSIDELPQLANVLRGEMSLVGPRPHPLPLNERFAHQVALYSARHRVLPGITGLAQIYGCRGETDTLEKMSARVRYDLQYIRDWSLWLDVRIIAATLLGRFLHANAY
jgi:putative colanic acid biosynthesis UDP-glucose lipid carrier transferase